MADITVLIPFYNPGSFLKKAVESIFKQTLSNWNIMLIDDGSTDESISHITSFLNDSRVTLLRNEKNIGSSKTLNIGLSNVTTSYVIQLDPDDWLETCALELLTNEMRLLPEKVGVLSGNMRVFWEQKKRTSRRSKVIKGRAFNDKYKFIKYNRSIWPRMYRTSALKEVGGWPIDDPFEGRYAEDIRILSRLIEKYDFAWIDHVLINHRRHSNNQTNDKENMNVAHEWIVRDNLLRWGDEFDPVFKYRKDRLYLSKLISK
jgi:glycosyltransferase involved in cell wall biosynthesis